MVDLNLETAFSQLQLTREDFFHPCEGYEMDSRRRGSLVLRSQCGPYSGYLYSTGHCLPQRSSQEVFRLVSSQEQHTKFHIYLKVISPMHTTRRSKNAAHTFPPSTPPPARFDSPACAIDSPPARHPQLKAETPTARTGVQTDPSTLTGSPKKLMYVYSRDDGSTIYADPREASLAARRGLADGSFRKVDVTPRVRDAFNHATESALEVYYISSDDE
ncbi:hypothetical protein B0H14DRAFT_2573549 [Mycena olivaceomarginata]|nr:hypothetical protein B0H14DRAFT_2573549 [Mycena olivaceomarginata]